ncbi:MAG: peptidoglycan-binding domain-containing protein [Candidatus Omnitrophota bacterium]
MRTFLAIAAVLFLGIYMFGCGKKEAPQMGEQMNMEGLVTVPATEVTPSPEAKMPNPPAAAPAVDETADLRKLEPLPPAGPFKPSAVEIQTALKNAGYYTGALDGKLGPMSKKAVGEFQKAHNLKADGKVGPKTWEALKAYLNAKPEAGESKKR